MPKSSFSHNFILFHLQIVFKNMYTTIIRNVTGGSGAWPRRCMSANTYMYGNLQEATAAAYTGRIWASGAVLHGDLLDLAKFTKITHLYLAQTQGTYTTSSDISGSLEELAEAMIGFGRADGTTLEVECNGKITVGGDAVADHGIATISFHDGSYTISVA